MVKAHTIVKAMVSDGAVVELGVVVLPLVLVVGMMLSALFR